MQCKDSEANSFNSELGSSQKRGEGDKQGLRYLEGEYKKQKKYYKLQREIILNNVL